MSGTTTGGIALPATPHTESPTLLEIISQTGCPAQPNPNPTTMTQQALKKLWNAWKKTKLPAYELSELKNNYSSVYFIHELEFNCDALLEVINVHDKSIKFCTNLGWLCSIHGVGPHVDNPTIEHSHLCILNPKTGFGVTTIANALKLPFRHRYDHPCVTNYKQQPGDLISLRTDKLHWLDVEPGRRKTVNNNIWAALSFSTKVPIRSDKQKRIYADVIAGLQDKYIHKL